MDRWEGKLAVVTGAGSGIGAAIAEALAFSGVNVLALDVKVVRLFSLKEKVKSATGKVYPKQCDVTKLDDVQSVFEWAKANFGGVDILINNAGVVQLSKITEGDTESFRRVLQTNVLAVATFTKEAVQSMRLREVDGHIVNVNSIYGHRVPDQPRGLYSPSKFAITALTETVRKELIDVGTKIKITSISPGCVNSEILNSAAAEANVPVPEEDIPRLEPSDIADAVIYILSTPPHVQISELTIQPSGQTW